MNTVDEEIVDLIRSVCEQESVIFQKAVRQRIGKSQLIKVVVDTEAGITLGHCQNLSKKISDLFFRKNILNGNYRLEVSSPGVEKPLEFPYEYKRNSGRVLEVIHEQDGQETRSRGTLVHYDEKSLHLQVEDQTTIEIPLERIKRSYVKLQW
jgi:ribosome maturation factor RimP